MPSPRQLRWCQSILALTLATLSVPPATQSAQLEWIGGTDSSWHTPTNWAPIAVPGADPIQRVPQDEDTVLIADTTNGAFVRLDGDSARLAGLTLESGFELDANRHFLLVEYNGKGTTVIRGEGTRLTLPTRPGNLTAFQADLLEVLDGGTFEMLDDSELNDTEVAHIVHGGVVSADSLFTGRGTVVFGNDMTPADAVLFRNDGTIRPIRSAVRNRTGRLDVTARGGGLIDYDGASEQGTIDVDEPGSVAFGNSSTSHQADPFNGLLLVGADDSAKSPAVIKDARMEFNGSDEDSASWGPFFSGQMQVSGHTSIHVNSGVAGIVVDSHSPQSPQFLMKGGSIHIHEDATLSFGGSDQSGSHELSGESFLMDDGSTLTNGAYNYVTLNFEEFDLDGDNRPATVEVVFFDLIINGTQIDNDPLSPGFDGLIGMYAGNLTVNIPGGWELSGRLAMSNVQTNSVRGSTITVNSGGPDDGIYVAGNDFDSTIYADLIFTENAQIQVEIGDLRLDGNVTNFRPELGTGLGALVFRGDTTTFAVPTTLNVGAVFDRGTVVLEGDLTIGSDAVVRLEGEASFSGAGRIVNEGFLEVGDGDAVDVPLLNRGRVGVGSTAPPGELTPRIAEFEQTESGSMSFSLSAEGPHDSLVIEGEARLDGRLVVTNFGRTQALVGRSVQILAVGGIEGRFVSYSYSDPLDRGILRVAYDETSVFAEIVQLLGGDYNGSGTVEQGDLDLVLLNWGADAMTRPDGWVNDLPSGLVDQDELDRVLLGWGDLGVFPFQGAVGVPEPTSITLLLAALLAVGLVERGHRLPQR